MKTRVAVSAVLATLLIGAFVAAGPFDLQARAAGQGPVVITSRDSAESSGHGGNSDGSELLVGRVTCGSAFGSPGEISLAVRFSGTIDVKQTDGPYGQELVEIQFVADPNPCPNLFQQAADKVEDLGCTHGSIGLSVQFLCQGDRDRLVRIMTTLGKGVLRAQF